MELGGNFSQPERRNQHNMGEMKTNMRHAFGQVNAKEIAFEKFQKIQQGNRTAATYWVEFQLIKAHLSYADNVCIARFQDGLPPEVKRHLVMSEVPATVLVDYATAAIKTDSRLCDSESLIDDLQLDQKHASMSKCKNRHQYLRGTR